MTSPIKSNFRHDINTLRAIAVLSVIFFHFKIPFFNGGFCGVDIFFVISGYLMTRIVINGLSTDNFSLMEFYNKRGQRIVPALAFLIAIVIIITFFIYLPSDFHDLTKNAAASILFYSNILYSKVNYFDASSDNNMFLHTWSLSVEWQFYLILPIFLMLVNKLFKNNRNKYLILFIGLAALFFIIAIIANKLYPVLSFFYLPTRAWEMLVGGIAFLAEDKIKWKSKKISAVLGYLILAVCIFGLNTEMKWPGIYTVAPVMATFLVIISNYNNFKILKSPLIQEIGKISYSLYLWHWPILVIGTYLGLINISFAVISVLLIISFIMAFISYRFIESAKIPKPSFVITITTALAIVTYILTVTKPNQIAFKKATIEIADYRLNHKKESDQQFNAPSCFITVENKVFNKDNCLYIDKSKSNYLLFGDSHAAQFYQSFNENFRDRDINLIQASASGCTAVIDSEGEKRCMILVNYMYQDFIPKNAKNIDGVILSSNWANSNQELLVKQIEQTLIYFKKLNIPVIIIGQNKTYSISYTSIAAREYENQSKISERYVNTLSTISNSVLKSRFKDHYIDIYTYKGLKLSANNIPYMSDANHFTKEGADKVVKGIMSTTLFKQILNIH